MVRLGGLAAVLFLLLAPFGARAASPNLRVLALRGSEVPAGFTHPRTHLYRHVVPKMSVAARAGNVPGPVTCVVPSFAAHDGMRQGFIQGFSSTRTGYALEVCAYSFAARKGAHAFFAGFAKKYLLARVKMHLDSRLKFHAGNESVATNHGEATCSCSSAITLRVYTGLWRQGNVVVSVSYAGPSSYSSGAFLSMLSTVDRRLA